MIVGHGDIASALKEVDRDDLLFFASGVSNSREKRESEYTREKALLLAQNKSRHIVYISSLCVFYSVNRYAQHKLEMENLVKENFEKRTIIRLGNITWGDNPHTIINYLRNRKRTGQPLEIQDAYRYVIDKDEFQYWIKMIPSWPCEMNLPGRRLKVQQIVDEFVNI